MDIDMNVFGPVILDESNGSNIPVNPKDSDDSETVIE